jgi:hypothetical protein
MERLRTGNNRKQQEYHPIYRYRIHQNYRYRSGRSGFLFGRCQTCLATCLTFFASFVGTSRKCLVRQEDCRAYCCPVLSVRSESVLKEVSCLGINFSSPSSPSPSVSSPDQPDLTSALIRGQCSWKSARSVSSLQDDRFFRVQGSGSANQTGGCSKGFLTTSSQEVPSILKHELLQHAHHRQLLVLICIDSSFSRKAYSLPLKMLSNDLSSSSGKFVSPNPKESVLLQSHLVTRSGGGGWLAMEEDCMMCDDKE